MEWLTKIDPTIVPLITALASSVVTYLIARGGNKKDITINDRQLLSEDEKAFRAELRQELMSAKEEITSLRTEVKKLHETNLKLELENQSLHIKLDALRFELVKYHEIESTRREEDREESQ